MIGECLLGLDLLVFKFLVSLYHDIVYVTLVMHERILIIKKRKGSFNEEKLRILSLDVFCERDDSMNTFLFLILAIFEFLPSNYNLVSSNKQISNILTEKFNESTTLLYFLRT